MIADVTHDRCFEASFDEAAKPESVRSISRSVNGRPTLIDSREFEDLSFDQGIDQLVNLTHLDLGSNQLSGN